MSKTATVKLKTEGVTQLTSELNKAAKAADNLEDSLDETAEAADDISNNAINAYVGRKLSAREIRNFKKDLQQPLLEQRHLLRD